MRHSILLLTLLLLGAGSLVFVAGCLSDNPNNPYGMPTPTPVPHTSTPTSTPTGSPDTPTNTPTMTATPTITNTPTATTTAASVTITVSTAYSTTSSTYYIYTSSSGSNGTGGVLNLTAHANDTIILPANSTHPLWFDMGSSTCIGTGGNTSGPVTYVFPPTGSPVTYYFHCGNHGSCSPNNMACGLTTCGAMRGIVTVN